MSKSPIIPSIGRIILHHGKDGQIRPGIVTHVHSDDCINATVFGKDSSDIIGGLKTSLMYDGSDDPAVGTWHWMPYQLSTAVPRPPALPCVDPVITTDATVPAAPPAPAAPSDPAETPTLDTENDTEEPTETPSKRLVKKPKKG